MIMKSLMDIFPTVTELCGLPEKQGLSGRSLIPLLKNPNPNGWSRPIVTVESWEHFSIRKDHWHYIEYGDGTAELYNLAEESWSLSNELSLVGSKCLMWRRMHRKRPISPKLNRVDSKQRR